MFWFLDSEVTRTLDYFIDNFLLVQVLVLPTFLIIRRFLSAYDPVEYIIPTIFGSCLVCINIIF